MTAKSLYNGENLNNEESSQFPVLSNCQPQERVYLQKMFGECHLHLRPDLLRALGQGRGFASQNASASRGSVKSVMHHNKGSVSKKVKNLHLILTFIGRKGNRKITNWINCVNLF